MQDVHTREHQDQDQDQDQDRGCLNYNFMEITFSPN